MKSETCEFSNVDEQIRNQIIEKCASNNLRRKLLQKDRAPTLKQLRDTARDLEDSERQARSIEGISSSVNRISLHDKPREKHKPRDEPPRGKSQIICYSCGYQGHKSKDPNCPAKVERPGNVLMWDILSHGVRPKYKKGQKSGSKHETKINT